MTAHQSILIKKEISKLKRYAIGIIRTFLGGFIVTFGAQTIVLPQTGIKEFLFSAALSSAIAGTTAVLKWLHESLFLTSTK